MLESRTAFVVGAGANHEFRFPLGIGLKNEVARLIDIKFNHPKIISGDVSVYEALRLISRDSGVNVNDYLATCWRAVDAMPHAASVDHLMHSLGEDDPKLVRCVKLGIVRAILSAESQCSLATARKRTINSSDIADFRQSSLGATWTSKFFSALTAKTKLSGVDRMFDNYSFIVFNYDRIIEYFLRDALVNYFQLSLQGAEEIVDRIDIVHVYGDVGAPDWRREDLSVSLGCLPRSAPQASSLVALSERVHAFVGEMQDETVSKEIARIVGDVDNMVFLGFGYHQQNLDRLFAEKHKTKDMVLGTTFGMSDANRRIVVDRLKRATGAKRFDAPNVSAAQLFADFSFWF
jgi:hypothetical protein